MVSVASHGRRVLACDDEPQILCALKVILREDGYAVITAGDIDDALNAVSVSPVDAAIVDLLLPDGDGLELCRRLREWSDMPIIVVSAIGDEEQKVSALKAGADDYGLSPVRCPLSARSTAECVNVAESTHFSADRHVGATRTDRR